MKGTRSSSHLFRGGGQETARVFAQRLEELKQTGCSILVTGTVDSEGFAEQLSLSLGNQTCKQVLVSPYQLSTPGQMLPADISPAMETVRVVTGEQARSTASTGRAGGADDLTTLREAVLDAITELSDEFKLEDNDLRVGVQSLDQFSDWADGRAVRRFVQAISKYVGLVNGTVYCQLRGDSTRASEVLDVGLFDARIELRSQQECVEQRWHLPDEDITTEWVSL